MAKEKNIKSNQRIISTILNMIDGDKINLHDAASEFEVSERTIQRDMSTIKHSLMADGEQYFRFHHDIPNDDYYLTTEDIVPFEEIFAIMKVLVGTRTFTAETLNEIKDNLSMTVGTNQQKNLDKVLTTVKHGYNPVSTRADLVELISKFNTWIENKQAISFMYTNSAKNPGPKKMKTAVPLSLYFAEHYFYVVLYVYEEGKESEGVSYVHRLDRFYAQPEVIGKFKFEIPRDKIEDEENIRSKSYLMNSGEIVNCTFIYYGNPDIARDQLPNCKITKNSDDTSTIETYLSYYGARMWAISRGADVKVIAPTKLVKDVKDNLKLALSRY